MNSTDPFDAPIINPNLLGTEVDVAIMREAVKAARSFVSAPAWSDYIISEYGAFGQAHTDEELDAYIRNNTDTIDHPVGTVATVTIFGRVCLVRQQRFSRPIHWALEHHVWDGAG